VAGRDRRRPRRTLDLSRYRGIVDDWDAFVEAADRPEPTFFRVRTGRIGEEQLVSRLEQQGFRLESVSGLPAFYRVDDGPVPVSLTLEHWDGLIYVQQASTGTAAKALGVEPGDRVLDLCAAPGGKTSHIAELMGDRGCLVAAEIDERRIRGLLGNLYRLLHTGVLVVACDGRNFPEGALFDRVLVDAPCSGEGTLRKRAGEAPNQSKAFTGRVSGVQRALLEKAVRLTRPGGTILYVTCTFTPEENEAVVSDVLAGGAVDLEPLSLDVPHARGVTAFEGSRYDERLAGAVRLYPHHLDSGGLFLAKLRRVDGVAGRPDRGASSVEGWSAVPSVFPDEPLSEAAARALVESALEGLSFRYGATPSDLAAFSWTVRGGRVWAHTSEAWPLAAWPEGAWRPIALGIRAIEFDSGGRPRPTNDLLRLLGARLPEGRLEVAPERLRGLLSGRPEVDAASAALGPVALSLDGTVIGRGAYTRAGLVSEIPKARAVDLERALAARTG
jgi:NOL1/NOP2/sun family putative RNA methylase